MAHASWVTGFDNFFEGLVHSIPNLQSIMHVITFLADTKVDLVWMLLIAVILWLKKQRPLSASIVISLVTVDAFGWIVKHIIQRARPAATLAADDGSVFLVATHYDRHSYRVATRKTETIISS